MASMAQHGMQQVDDTGSTSMSQAASARSKQHQQCIRLQYWPAAVAGTIGCLWGQSTSL
jgi:hypothetical protein